MPDPTNPQSELAKIDTLIASLREAFSVQFGSVPELVRSVVRYGSNPNVRDLFIGFRVLVSPMFLS